jgi:hypothetical protein
MTTRHNRCPVGQERNQLLTQIRQDEQLLSLLNVNLASRLESLATTEVEVQNATRTLEEAERRLSYALKRHTALNNTLPLLQEIVQGDGQSSTPADASSDSPHLITLREMRREDTDLIHYVDKSLVAADKNLRDAYEAVAICRENRECAITIYKFSGEGTDTLRRSIADVESLISRKRVAMRPTWCIPDEVWARIFSLVVFDANVSSIIQPSDIQTLVINDVCVRWRTIVQSHFDFRSHLSGKGWSSIDNITIPADTRLNAHILPYTFPRLRGLQTIHLHGDTVDTILLLLLKKKAGPQLFQCKTAGDSPDSWQLQRLTISDYVGNGANIIRFADECHTTRYKLLNGEASFTRANGMSRNNISHEASTLFVTWYFRKRGLPAPTVAFYAGIIPVYTMRVHGTVIGTSNSMFLGTTQEQALISCYQNSVRNLLNETPNLWDKFLEDVRAGRDGAERLFKVELNNCQISDASNLQNLELYR